MSEQGNLTASQKEVGLPGWALSAGDNVARQEGRE